MEQGRKRMNRSCFICCSKTKLFVKCQACQNEEQCIQCVLSQGEQMSALDTLENAILFQCPYCRKEFSFDDVTKNIIPLQKVCCPFTQMEYDYRIVGKRGVLSRKRKIDVNSDSFRELQCEWIGLPSDVTTHVKSCKLVSFVNAIKRNEENDLFFLLDLFVKLGNRDGFEELLLTSGKIVLSQADSFQTFREAMNMWPTSRELVWKTFSYINRGTLLFFIHTGLFEEFHDSFIKIASNENSFEEGVVAVDACLVTLDFLLGHRMFFEQQEKFLFWFKMFSLFTKLEDEVELEESILVCKVKSAHLCLLICQILIVPIDELSAFLVRLMKLLQDHRITLTTVDVYNFMHPLSIIFEQQIDFSNPIFDGVLVMMVDTLFLKSTSLPVKLNLFDVLIVTIQSALDENLVLMLGNYILKKISSCNNGLRESCIDPRDIFHNDEHLSTLVLFESFPICKAAKNFNRYYSSTLSASRTDADEYAHYLVNKFTMFFLVSSLLTPETVVAQRESIESLMNLKMLDLCVAIQKVCVTASITSDLSQNLDDFIRKEKRISWNEVTLLELLMTFLTPVFQKEKLYPHTYEYHVAKRHIKFLRLEHLRSELLVNVMEEIVVVV